jgi:hypothetical protein
MQFTSLDDLIASNNPVRILDAFREKLNLSELGIKQPDIKQQRLKANARGAPRFDDKLLLKVVSVWLS